MFQSTHPHGVRPRTLIKGICPLEFQSTHPHGVRHEFGVALVGIAHVSIHAPTRGATLPHYKGKVQKNGFNPRTHTGCDGCWWVVCVWGSVSIHAPTRGATLKIDGIKMPCLFQSTHPHGVRQSNREMITGEAKFQSTHPHGVRPAVLRGAVRLKVVSIHAPTRGATISICLFVFPLRVSIHAPTRGATP